MPRIMVPKEVVAVVLFAVDGRRGRQEVREDDDVQEEQERGGAPSRGHGAREAVEQLEECREEPQVVFLFDILVDT